MGLFGHKKQEVVEETPPEPVGLPEAPPLDDNGLRKVSDHTEYLLSLVEPLRPFGMGLLDAWDQVMCEDINSTISVPPNSTAKTAGYAVRAEDLFDEEGKQLGELSLVRHCEQLQPGAAAPVEAGQTLPLGTTTVLPVTFAEPQDDRLKLLGVTEPGEYIRAAGEHLALGSRLLSEGEVLDSRSIGMLASAGIDKVLVRPRPRVVVVSSGADLVEPGSEVGHGESTDANSFMIAAAAKAAGATVFRVAVHTSDTEVLKQAITDQLIRADLVISTTAGRREEYQAVMQAMSELGAFDSVNVAMSPGRMQSFGLIGEDRVPMVMLPGNPISAYVTFQAFVWPLIRKLSGANSSRRLVRAITTGPIRSMKGQVHLLRGTMTLTGSINQVERVHEAYGFAELKRTNCLIVLDEETDQVSAGGSVYCWMLDEE